MAKGNRAGALLALGTLAAACRGEPPRAEAAAQRTQAVEANTAIWTDTTAPLSDERKYHGAALLDAGHVLICGGRREGVAGKPAADLTSCDVFTTAGASLASAGAGLGAARAFLTLTHVGADRVYAIGGLNAAGLTSTTYGADVWSFSSSSGNVVRSSESSLGTARYRHSSSWLPTSRAIVVIGGFGAQDLAGTDEISRVDDNGSAVGFNAVDPPSSRARHSATVLSSGSELLVLGGRRNTNEALVSVRLLSVPVNGTASFGELAELGSAARYDHSATLLDDGRVLVVGGRNGQQASLDSAFFYVPKDGGSVVDIAAKMRVPRREHAAALLAHRVVVTGGVSTGDAATNTVEVFDPAAKSWFSLDGMKLARSGHSITVLNEHQLLITGGVLTNTSSTASAEVLTVRAQGEACDPAQHQCITGHCIDGVCCDTACDDGCSRCNAAGKIGVCQSDVSGDPIGGRDCGGGFACSAGACRTQCETHDDCLSTHYCSDGACKPRLVPKSACGSSRECAADSPCVDGYCCDSPCDGQCEACGEPGSLGKCIPVTGTARGARTACGAPSGDCGLYCNGEDRKACHFHSRGDVCGANSCEDALVRTQAQCDGIGNCNDAAEPCPGGLACNAAGTACLSSCTSNGDCADNGHKCSTATDPAVCVVKADLGKACERNSDCSEDLPCVEGYCCEQACPDAGWSCALDGHHGECRKRSGETCKADSECGSDFCVFGVCCESACSGQCETCSAEGHLGECRPKLGDPEPGRAPCADGADVCGKRSCDGVDRAANRASCRAYANPEAICEQARCDEQNRFIPESRCADGACGAVTPQDCGLYACTDAGCNTSCKQDADCNVATCQDGACKPEKPKCVDNQLVAPGAAPVSCAGYICDTDHCLTRCELSKDCADDFACDDVEHRCVKIDTPLAPSTPQSDDGCQCALPGAPQSDHSLFPAVAALLATSLLRRRARARTASPKRRGVA